MDDDRDRVGRRSFLRVGVAGAAGLIALGCDPGDDADAGAPTDAGGRADAGGGVDAGPPDAGSDAGPPRAALAIPPLYEGEVSGGVRRFALEMREGSMGFLPGQTTTTAGYDGAFLGPALALRTGEEVEIAVTNRLGHVTTTHWHGMHVPAAMDGGPHQPIADGETWTARFTVLNPASLCWFHPHAMGEPTDPQATSYQVWMGLAGLLWISDDEGDALALPRTYGVDFLPLVLQDRRFGDDGEFLHLDDPTDPMGMRKGDRFLVNGVIDPAFDAPAQRVRLRILNGSNARIYNLALVDAAGDDRELHQIGTDNALLDEPVALRRVVLSPGERAEVVLDLSGDEGGTLTLVSKNEELSASLYAGNFTRDAQDGQTNPHVHPDRRALGGPHPDLAPRGPQRGGRAPDQRPGDGHRAHRRGGALRVDRDLGDPERHPDGPPLPHPRPALPGALAQRDRDGRRPRQRAGLEGHRAAPRGRDGPRHPPLRGLRGRERSLHVPLPHPRARGSRDDGPVHDRAVRGGPAQPMSCRAARWPER